MDCLLPVALAVGALCRTGETVIAPIGLHWELYVRIRDTLVSMTSR